MSREIDLPSAGLAGRLPSRPAVTQALVNADVTCPHVMALLPSSNTHRPGFAGALPRLNVTLSDTKPIVKTKIRAMESFSPVHLAPPTRCPSRTEPGAVPSNGRDEYRVTGQRRVRDASERGDLARGGVGEIGTLKEAVRTWFRVRDTNACSSERG